MREYTLRDALADMLYNAQLQQFGRELDLRTEPLPRWQPPPQVVVEMRQPEPPRSVPHGDDVDYGVQHDRHCWARQQAKQARRWAAQESAVRHAYDTGAVEELVQSLYPTEVEGHYFTELDPAFVHDGWQNSFNRTWVRAA